VAQRMPWVIAQREGPLTYALDSTLQKQGALE